MYWSVALAVVLLLASSIGADDKIKNSEVKSVKGKCSATFPGKPKQDASKTSETYVLGLTEDDDKSGYFLSITYLKPKVDMSNEEEVNRAMNDAYRAVRLSVGKKASNQSDNFFGSDRLPHRYYEFELANGGVYLTNMVLTGDRLISISVSGPKQWSKTTKVQDFLNSLRVEALK